MFSSRDGENGKKVDLLQKPEALTTFGQSDVQKHKMPDYRNIQPARGGQLTPAGSGQWHRLFQ